MSDVEREIAVEQAYLDRVNARLDAAEAAARDLGDEAIARGALYAEGGVREEDARTLYESDVFMHHSVLRRWVLNAEREGLLFGRLDFANGDARYVGRIGVRDEQREPLVLDWRAPAAAAYYRATPLDPRGVVRRRTIASVGRRVTGVDDDLLDADHVPEGMAFVGDGALLSAMARTRDEHMGTIVATIQADQDAAIRAPAEGTTLITGGPGTGKTVVALHRVAYLLFTDRRRFESGGVLVVGPTAAFVRYIDRVLPSLGEDTVELRSLGDVLNGLSISRPEHGPAADLKGSLRLLPVLRRAIARTMPAPDRPLRLRLGEGAPLEVFPQTAATLRDAAFEGAEDWYAARRAGERAIVDLLWSRARGHGLSRAAFADAVRHHRGFSRFMRGWWYQPDPRDTWAKLHERTFLARCADGLLTPDEVDTLSEAWTPGARLTVPDVAVLDELLSLSGWIPHEDDEEEPEQRPGKRVHFAHVVVDEAQELTPLQWRMLARRGPRASWTIVADRAQSALADRDAAAAAMEAALPAPRHPFRLGTNYRNPREIFVFATRALGAQLGDADLPIAARSGGREPEVRVTSEEVYDAALRDAVRDMLATVPGSVALIGDDVEGLDGRVRVLTPLESKGLEFDGVVVARPERIAQFGSPAVGARLLYVVLTRATQHLVCVTTDPEWPAG